MQHTQAQIPTQIEEEPACCLFLFIAEENIGSRLLFKSATRFQINRELRARSRWPNGLVGLWGVGCLECQSLCSQKAKENFKFKYGAPPI